MIPQIIPGKDLLISIVKLARSQLWDAASSAVLPREHNADSFLFAITELLPSDVKRVLPLLWNSSAFQVVSHFSGSPNQVGVFRME